jgi:hypothetical protein
MLLIQQEEKRRKLRERNIQLRERAQIFAEERARKADQLRLDRVQIAIDTWQFILLWLRNKETQAVAVVVKHSDELLLALEKHVEESL